MAVIVAIAGEFKFYPFYNPFRVSMATPAFLFFLLWNRHVPVPVFGLTTAVTVPAFRICLDILLHKLPGAEAFQSHHTVFFYYVTYTALFYLLRIDRLHQRPLVMGLLAAITEIGANGAELWARFPATFAGLTLPEVNEIVLIAIFRSYCVIGLFILLKHREQQLSDRLRRQQYEQMLLLISQLYEEAVQLKKTQQDAERITRDSYSLYKRLQLETGLTGRDDLAGMALQIAGQIHEIKKDHQRIHAGIAHIISSESVTNVMPIQELGMLVIKANRKYARMLGKTIDFQLQTHGVHPLYPVNTLLSLLNNLVANSVEAINSTGSITLSAAREEEVLLLQVQDTGPGIPPKIHHALFEPGFTTKYDASGNASTGIGLYYVRELTEGLQGEVRFESSPDGKAGTCFTLRLPLNNLLHQTKDDT
ncbi:sensor histidine kinase [Paenibacillus sp. y28]